MASKNGPRALGTDGFDFEHRQKVANQYQVSAVNKSRLKSCIFLHFLLFLLMCLKLSHDVLDRLDIFVMEIEELEIPRPLTWEYVWTSSIVLAFVGLAAVRRNRIGRLKLYSTGIVALAVLPVVYAAIYYAGDLWTVLTHVPTVSKIYPNGDVEVTATATSSSSQVQRWRGQYPLAVLWYIFLAVAFQIHLFSLYFSAKLINAWTARGVSLSSTTSTTTTRTTTTTTTTAISNATSSSSLMMGKSRKAE